MDKYVVAKYIRLSQDEAVSDSFSISNQRLLLDIHIEELDLPGTEVLEFVEGADIIRPTQESSNIRGFGGLVLFFALP